MEQDSLLLIVEDGRTPVVSLAGVIDLASRDEIWERLATLLDGTQEGLLVDLREVTFMDSRGLGILLRAREALGQGRCVTLLDPPPAVRRSLRLTGVDELFAVAYTPDTVPFVGEWAPKPGTNVPPLIG